MKLTNQVRPVSYLQAHAAEIIDELAQGGAPLIITQRGEAKAVLRDFAGYKAEQDALALLKILALSQKDVDEGRLIPAKEVYARIRQKAKRARRSRKTR
jgi:prevent-host-death family protein